MCLTFISNSKCMFSVHQAPHWRSILVGFGIDKTRLVSLMCDNRSSNANMCTIYLLSCHTYISNLLKWTSGNNSHCIPHTVICLQKHLAGQKHLFFSTDVKNEKVPRWRNGQKTSENWCFLLPLRVHFCWLLGTFCEFGIMRGGGPSQQVAQPSPSLSTNLSKAPRHPYPTFHDWLAHQAPKPNSRLTNSGKFGKYSAAIKVEVWEPLGLLTPQVSQFSAWPRRAHHAASIWYSPFTSSIWASLWRKDTPSLCLDATVRHHRRISEFMVVTWPCVLWNISLLCISCEMLKFSDLSTIGLCSRVVINCFVVSLGKGRCG